MKFAIVGGDKRNYCLFNMMKKQGMQIEIIGFENLDNSLNNHIKSNTYLHEIYESDVIIFGIPMSKDNENIYMPYSNSLIKISDIGAHIKDNAIIILGLLKEEYFLTYPKNCIFFDIVKNNEMAILNAVPTAEGAISKAIYEMPRTLNGCKALVTGYGRIGKILAQMLKLLNAEVYVSARKDNDFAWIEANGFTPLHSLFLESHISKVDVIFNTIPALIISKEIINLVKKDCVIIDLASKPGGVDFDYAKKREIKAFFEPGVPGRYSPFTAAQIIKKTIEEYLEKKGFCKYPRGG